MDQGCANILSYSQGEGEKGYWTHYENGELSFYVNQYVVPPKRTRLVFLAPLLIGVFVLLFTPYRVFSVIFLPLAFHLGQLLLGVGKWAVESNLKIQTLILTASEKVLKINPIYGFDKIGIQIPLDEIEDLWIEREKHGAVKQAMDLSLWKMSLLMKDDRLITMAIRCNLSADLLGLEVILRNAVGIGLNPTPGPTRSIDPKTRRQKIICKAGKIILRDEKRSGWNFRAPSEI